MLLIPSSLSECPQGIQCPWALHCELWTFSRHSGCVQVQYGCTEQAPLQRGLHLLGCLWVAAKHEECRFGMPTAQRIAWLVSGASGWFGTGPAAVGSAELLVLNLLDWQPLKGWDDLHHIKGRARERTEVIELCWLGCSRLMC